jgi:hypothetical protein
MKVYLIHNRTCDVAAIDSKALTSKRLTSKNYYVYKNDAMVAAEQKRQQIIRDIEDELDQLVLIKDEREEREELLSYYKNKKIKVLQGNGLYEP